ncbi:MAG: P83/100 family protein [Rectinemataceae bacterium]
MGYFDRSGPSMMEAATGTRLMLGLALLSLALGTATALPLEVAKSELDSTRDNKVTFVNYEGPQAVIESDAAIRGIGSNLATAVGKPEGRPGRAGDPDRYAVRRVIGPEAASWLDADIIIIGKNAVVDHIANIRRIVSGYLQTAWGYSRRDADLIAVFVTVYNAVYRGDVAYLGDRYKPEVMKELPAGSAGLSKNWKEWAGQTRIVIPLSAGAVPGAAGAVSTGTISEKAVTETMKELPGGGIGERQALVDIKEKEVTQGQATAEKAKTEAVVAAKVAVEATAKLATATAALEQAKAATAPPPAPAPVPPAAAPVPPAAAPEQPATAQAAAVDTTPAPAAIAVAAAEKAVAEATVAAVSAQAAAEVKAAAAEKAAAVVEEKKAEVAVDRTNIAEDQNKQIAKEIAAGAVDESAGIWLFEIVDAGYPYARIAFVDATTGTIFRTSVINTIHSRSIVDAGDVYVAVAGKTEGTGAIRLVAIDKKTLVQTAQGTVDIHPESTVTKIGEVFHACIKAPDGKYYLGRFDATLAETARSAEAVNPMTFVVQAPDGIVAQAASGGFLAFDAKSLVMVRKLGL